MLVKMLGQGETWMNMLSDGFWWWKWVRMKDLSFEILSESIPIVSWGDELESSKIRDQSVYILTKGQGQWQNQKNRFNWVYQILNFRKCAQPCASAGIATPNAGRLQGWQRRIFSGIIAANSGQGCAHNIPSGSVPSTIIASKSFFCWLKIISWSQVMRYAADANWCHVFSLPTTQPRYPSHRSCLHLWK